MELGTEIEAIETVMTATVIMEMTERMEVETEGNLTAVTAIARVISEMTGTKMTEIEIEVIGMKETQMTWKKEEI